MNKTKCLYISLGVLAIIATIVGFRAVSYTHLTLPTIRLV